MKASRPPHLPLNDLEVILGDVADLLERMREAAGVRELDGRLGQCRSAIAACRRYHFSPVLLRALSAKVLEVETDALVLGRTLRVSAREHRHENVRVERGRRDRRKRRRS